MQKFLKIFVVVLLLVAAIYYRDYIIFFSDSKESWAFNDKLEKFVDEGKDEFFLNELTDFEWSKVCVYLSYGYIKMSELESEGYKVIGNDLDLEGDGNWGLTFFDEPKKEAYIIHVTELTFAYYLEIPRYVGSQAKGYIFEKKSRFDNEAQKYLYINNQL